MCLERSRRPTHGRAPCFRLSSKEKPKDFESRFGKNVAELKTTKAKGQVAQEKLCLEEDNITFRPGWYMTKSRRSS